MCSKKYRVDFVSIHSLFLSLLKWKPSNIKKHLMSGPSELSKFCFSLGLGVSLRNYFTLSEITSKYIINTKRLNWGLKNWNRVCLAVFNLGRVFASLTRKCYFLTQGEIFVESYLHNIKILSNERAKWLSFQTMCLRLDFFFETSHAIPEEIGTYISTFCTLLRRMIHVLYVDFVLLFSFHYKTRTKVKFLFYAK